MAAEDPPPAPASPGSPGSRLPPIRAAYCLLGIAGTLLVTGLLIIYAVRNAAMLDVTGFDAATHAAVAGLGCVYDRSVQLAGMRRIPGVSPAYPRSLLAWHFNEPMPLAYLAYPISQLRLAEAVWIWELAGAAALVACGWLLWRRGGVAPLLACAVITSLLGNGLVGVNFWLGQDDAFLLLVLLWGLALLRGQRDWAAGAAFGVVALKPQLMFLVFAVLLFQRRWRAATAMGCVGAALAALSVALVGPSCAVTWARTASAVTELSVRVGLGLPMTLAKLTHTHLPAEVLFVCLSAGAAWLLWRLRWLDTELAVAVALGLALVIGLHVLYYDAMFYAPLGMRLAQRFPWHVFAAGWLITMAWFVDEITRWAWTAPLRLAQLVPMIGLAAAIVAISRSRERAAAALSRARGPT